MRTWVWMGLIGLAVAGCNGIFGGVVCTEEFRFGVNVTVTDTNGNPITGATLTLAEGDFQELMQEFSSGNYAGAGERAGTYTLTVAADGFETVMLTEIVVTADECHVTPVGREVTLLLAGSGPGATFDQLLADLTAAGNSVEVGDPITQPFFAVLGQIITVEGGDVQVFEFSSAEEAGAVEISPDGTTVDTTMINFVDTPHFYRSGTLIALYVGTEAAVIAAIEAVLGFQIAGG